MKKTIIVLFAIIFTASIAFAQDKSTTKNNLKFPGKTKTYTEPYSGTVVTIPEDWEIKEMEAENKSGESKTVYFIEPYKTIAVAFKVIDFYTASVPEPAKLLVKRNNFDQAKLRESLEKKSDKAEITEITLNGENYLRTISVDKFVMRKEDNPEIAQEVNEIMLLKVKNGYLYRFYSMTDISFEEYEDFETIVANTVFSEPKNE